MSIDGVTPRTNSSFIIVGDLNALFSCSSSISVNIFTHPTQTYLRLKSVISKTYVGKLSAIILGLVNHFLKPLFKTLSNYKW